MSTAIKRQSTISTSPFNNWTKHAEKCEICERVQLLQKGIIGKRMLKVKGARKGRPKNDVKDSTWTQSFFNSLSSQIKSDDIPSEVKLADVNNTDINPHITLCCCNSCGEILKKPMKVLKCKHRFCLNCLAACLSGKNEEESQCPACKMNILKADISPSSDLQTLLSLLKIQCNICSKKFLISTHYNDYTKHIQNCSLDISPPSSLLVTDIFNISDNDIPRSVEDATLHILKKKMKLNPGNSLIEFKTGGRVCMFVTMP